MWGPAQQCAGPDGVDHLQLYLRESDLESKSMGLFGALSCHEGMSPRPAFLVQGFRNREDKLDSVTAHHLHAVAKGHVGPTLPSGTWLK